MIIDQAMVLAAGFGKRLQPLTLTTPKPLIPVNHQPILDYTMAQLRQGHIRRCVINTHYLAEQIHHHLQDVQTPQITISHEQEILNTGGGIRHALPYFQDQPFFSVNGDIWWEQKDIFDQLRDMWNPDQMDGILVLVPREQAIDFAGPGDYFLESDHQLTHRGTEDQAPYIYSGIQLLHPRAFKDFTAKSFHLPEVYHAMEQSGRLYGLPLKGPWCDMGTVQTLARLEAYLQP